MKFIINRESQSFFSTDLCKMPRYAGELPANLSQRQLQISKFAKKNRQLPVNIGNSRQILAIAATFW